MIIVTGGAGFIGSRLVKGLNQRGYHDILVVDDLKDGKKFHNLVDCHFTEYFDKTDFLKKISTNYPFPPIDAIFHQGACSTTTEWDGQYLIENNYEYSKTLLHYALENRVPFYYASTAAIYGAETHFEEKPEYEKPLNMYGFSKLLFDRYARQFFNTAKSPVVGLRYFNVYGANENHKGNMISVIQHFYNQLKEQQVIRIFSVPGYLPGEQSRDFIFVNDVVSANIWLFEQSTPIKGIFNLGTGQSTTFNHVAECLIEHCGLGKTLYEPLPQQLQGCYQGFTEANITALRNVGFPNSFTSIKEAISQYLPSLQLCLSS